MNHVMRKLKSKRGASMLLAMMFMSFCVFVGGSVLSAAAANGSRVAKQAKDQQAYLSQRSAALVIADELKGHPDDQLQMTVVEKTTETTVKIPGRTDAVSANTTVSFELYPVEYVDASGIKTVVTKTEFQKLLYEAAVDFYILSDADLATVVPIFKNFDFASGHTYPHSLKKTGDVFKSELTVSDPIAEGAENKGSLLVNSDYDLQVDFIDDSKLSIFLNANVGTSEPVVVESSKEELVVEGSGEEATTSTKVTTTKITTTTTIIRWDDPVIRKGGASNE